MNVRIKKRLTVEHQDDFFDNSEKERKFFCGVIEKYYDYFILKNPSNQYLGKYVSQLSEEDFKKIVEILSECPEILEKGADLTKPKPCVDLDSFCENLNENSHFSLIYLMSH